MKLAVEIVRDEAGYLSAYVVQDGKRGTNLLADRSLSDVNLARIVVRADFDAKHRGEIEIVWTGEQPGDWHRKRASDTAIATKRDAYGWRTS